MSINRPLLLATLIAGMFAAALIAESDANKADQSKVPPVLDFTMNRLNGEPAHLGQYAGRVVLIVNVASRCGQTPQYKGLQKLHEKYNEQGLDILGFPANEFGNQEPGSNEDIAAFCEKNYGVSFDMFAKVIVKGEGICDLYQYLTSKETNPDFAGDIKWNFEKFLIDRQGNIIARFPTRVQPDAEQVIRAIETALAQSLDTPQP